MDYPKYQLKFMSEAIPGYCSTACFMGILNYFWYTQFNMRDNWDLIKIAKLWRYKNWDGLDEKEIAYVLEKLWFDVDIYTGMTKEQFEEYMQHPLETTKKLTQKKYQKYIQDIYRKDGNYNPTMINLTDISIYQKIIDEKKILIHFDEDIDQIITNNISENTLFLVWLNRYVLYNEKEVDGESGWHVVLIKDVQNNSFEIYDSWPEKTPIYIKKSQIIQAMCEMWPYIFIKITKKDD